MRKIPLETPLAAISGIGPRLAVRLKKLGLMTVRDLLWHFPSRYEDLSQIVKISEAEAGMRIAISGIIEEVRLRRTARRNMAIVEALISDESGSIHALWFNQPYLVNTLRTGRWGNFAGKVAVNDELYLQHPEFELISAPTAGYTQELQHTGKLIPIYSETKGLTSKGLRFLIQPILKAAVNVPEWIPEAILEAEKIPEINVALTHIHIPDNLDHALMAKRRFAFEELLLMQLLHLIERSRLAKEKAYAIGQDIDYVKKILSELPFELTFSQKRSLWEILQDIERPRPMNRLLQGDVGSGKTVVAAIATILTAHHGYQAAFMAPTEILARQHFATLAKIIKTLPAGDIPTIGILTSSEAKIIYEGLLETTVKKSEFIKQMQSGAIAIVIGTHALIEKTVGFKHLALVIIDEQHRFGVRQRQALMRRQTPTETQTNADEKQKNLLYEDLTYKIRSCALTLKKNLGLGHKELIYQKALAMELKATGLIFERGEKISVIYKEEKVGTYQPDFLIDNKIIVELKALPFMGKNELKQIWTYLKGSPYKLALLINFSPTDVDFKRIVNDIARESPRESAPSPYQSAFMPHLLSMSATPIPRTLMLSIFGDLDISLIDELPTGRKPIMTKIVPPSEREIAYQFIREEIKNGRQAFVICPRIESNANDANDMRMTQIESDDSHYSHTDSHISHRFNETKAVKEEYEKLSTKVFADLTVAMLHGKMPAKGGSASGGKSSKEEVMRDFAAGKIDVLVATSVVEVGVDIPNASVMMIEGSERFGLAQLYQFRGRVGRGEYQSHCLLMTESALKSTEERLKALLTAKNGLELAEHDLKIRGPGEFLGNRQTGMPDYAMRALQDPELIRSTRSAATKIVQTDPHLAKYPLLQKKIRELQDRIHQE